MEIQQLGGQAGNSCFKPRDPYKLYIIRCSASELFKKRTFEDELFGCKGNKTLTPLSKTFPLLTSLPNVFRYLLAIILYSF